MIASVSSSVDRHRRRGSLDSSTTTVTNNNLINHPPAHSAPPTGPSSGGFGRAASIRRRASLLRQRLPNKSSPHVGWFRHAPPTTLQSSTSRVSPSSSMTSSNMLYPSSLHMETSPFIGWFRHAPPSELSLLKKRTCSNSSVRDLLDDPTVTSKKHIKITPPSSSSSSTNDKENHADVSSEEAAEILEAFLKKISTTSSSFVDGRLPGGQPLHGAGSDETNDNVDYASTYPPLTFLDQTISLSLQHPTATRTTSSTTAPPTTSPRTEFDDAASSSTSTTAFAGNSNTPSATCGILDRLIHWLIFPAGTGRAVHAYDADAIRQSRLGSGIINAILPFFSSLLKNVLLLENGGNAGTAGIAAVQLGDNRRTTNRNCRQEDDSISSCDSDSDDSSCSSSSPSDDGSDASGFQSPLASSPLEQAEGGLSQLLALDVSVSSLAERYYAHEAFKELVGSSTSSISGIGADSTSSSGAGTGTAVPNAAAAPTRSSQQESLDYVITQIDIARMIRNASRHLDVESILSLPTITYVSKKQSEHASTGSSSQQGGTTEKSQQQNQASTSQETQDEDLNWSWMMVPGDMDDIDESKPSGSVEQDARQYVAGETKEEEKGGQLISDIDEDTCVICLEHFVDGDRLRVLPCEHLFHVGCIDKWLSGSSSEEECFTHGCPTCKKHPVRCHEEEEVAGSGNDGSVPSWAFARLGDVLASSASTLSR